MDWTERIAINPDVLAGKPGIRGTRISVEFILELLGNDWSRSDVLEEYPRVSEQDILACLLYAKDLLQSERIYVLPPQLSKAG
jgi:uncharacterized protein (DUF433 family)